MHWTGYGIVVYRPTARLVCMPGRIRSRYRAEVIAEGIQLDHRGARVEVDRWTAGRIDQPNTYVLEALPSYV